MFSFAFSFVFLSYYVIIINNRGKQMKKYLFFVLGFILICSAIFTLAPAKITSINAINESNDDLSEFLQFEQKIIDMNNSDDNVFYTSDNYSATYANEVLDTNEEIEKCEESEFSLKRLIVQGKLTNTFGAIDRASYNNLHILCYETEQETQFAYEKLKELNDLDVVIDKYESVEEYAEKDYTYTSYKNWGAESIDIGGYRELLVDNNVKDEIVVVVLDTGINTSHSMFSNRLLKDKNGKVRGYSYYNSTYRYSYDNLGFDVDDPNTKDIYEGDSRKYSFEDDQGHGTHVAGIVCDLTPDNVKILPIKIGGANGKSTTAIMISAHLRVLNIYSKQYNIVCTNLSYSGGGKTDEDDKNTFNSQCYQPLLDINILPITAAGNDYDEINIDGLKAVVVSSLKKIDNQYLFENDYSNYGTIVDIAAPGSDINSAAIASEDGATSNYVLNSGTSMASPQVAGAVALLYLNPNLPADFKATDIEEMLYEYSLDFGEPGKDIWYGHGILNLKYFDVEKVDETLSFYENNQLVTEYEEYKNFEQNFKLSITCSNPNLDIIYTTNKKIPSISQSTTYSSGLDITNTIYIYAMGIKVENGEIIERTELYNISYFSSTTPIEDCFTITERGYLDNYIGNYTSLVIPTIMKGRTVVGLEPSVFKNSKIEYIVLPETCTTFGGYVFKHCINLKYIYAPGFTKAYMAAFDGCISLPLISDQHPTEQTTEGAYFPELVETIGFTFNNCTNLKSVSLSKLTIAGESQGYDFQNCKKLTNANLPAIRSISKGLFNLCESLTGVFHIGENVVSIGSNAFTKTKLNGFTVDSNNEYFGTDGKGIYTKDSLVTVVGVGEDVDYTILENITIKGQNYPITKIAESAMLYVEYNNLTIPESITTIEKFAFYGSVINNLYFNATNCSSNNYFVEGDGLYTPFYQTGTIIIGENVQQVPQRLFSNSNFTNLILTSKNTKLTTKCFARNLGDDIFNRLVFDFTDTVDAVYLSMVCGTSGLFNQENPKYICSKNTISVSSYNYTRGYTYYYHDGTYHVYSEQLIVDTYTITASSNEYGTINPSGVKFYDEGTNAQYTFTAKLGYYVESIIVDGKPLTGNALTNAIEDGYTFTNITENHTISLICSPEIYTIKYFDGPTEINGLLPSTYSIGSSFELPTPIEKQGHDFIGWYDNSSFSGLPITNISVKDYGNKTLYARYELKTFTITVIQAENGVISDASPRYNYGSNAHFTFTANYGYHVEHILIDGEIYTDNLSEYTFTNITENHTISALFTSNANVRYSVKHWQESLTQSGATLINSRFYNLVETDSSKTGMEGELTQAIANTYVGFTSQPFEQQIININGTIVNILYNRNAHTVTLNKDAGVNTVSGGGDFLFGQTVTLNATLLEGYELVSWISSNSNLVENGLTLEYSFVMPDGDIEFSAQSKIKQFTMTIQKVGDGTISSNQLVDYNGSFELEFEPGLGSEFIKLQLDGDDVTSSVVDNKYSISNIKENHILIVTFDLITYTITTQDVSNGTISPNEVVFIKYGQSQKYTFTPKFGYHLESISIDGEPVSEDEVANAITNGYTISNVIKNLIISATFTKDVFTISAGTNGFGSISPSGDIKVEYGENKTFTFEPIYNYKVYNVLVNGKDVGAVDSYTFYEICENQTIYVVFDLVTFKITSSSDENGSITPSADVKLGNKKRFDFYPNEGYEILDVKIDGISFGAINYYIFENVNLEHSISVEYIIKKFNISVYIDGKGIVNNMQSIEQVSYGESRQFAVYAKKGWELYKVYANGKEIVVTDNLFSIDNIKENISVQVLFDEIEEESNYTGLTISIIVGTIVISAGLTILTLQLKKNTKKKTIKESIRSGILSSNQFDNLQAKENISTPNKITRPSQMITNPLLEKAYDFVQDKELKFISYCKRFGIDYENDYDNAVLRFYQSYLRSIKK